MQAEGAGLCGLFKQDVKRDQIHKSNRQTQCERLGNFEGLNNQSKDQTREYKYIQPWSLEMSKRPLGNVKSNVFLVQCTRAA